MAAECRDLIRTIQSVEGGLLDSCTIDQLEDAKMPLVGRFGISEFLSELEKVQPENEISSQLRALFLEAIDGFSNIHSHEKDQGRKNERFQRISKALKIITLENIAERIEASKPSRSSSQITMEMVGLVNALLYCTEVTLYRVAIYHDTRVGIQHNAREAMQLQKKLRSIRVIFKLTAKRCIEHESMKDLFTVAEDAAYHAAHLYFLWLANEHQAPALDHEFSKLLERISPFRPELRQIYLSALIGSESPRSETTTNVTYLTDFVSALQEDLKERLTHDVHLKVYFDGRIPFVQGGLLYLYTFLLDVESAYICLGKSNSLISHIEALAIEAATMIYSSYDEEMDKTTEVNNGVFLFQLKFNHVMVEGDLIQLLNSEATLTPPLEDLIDYVWGELIFLRTFLMDLSEQYKEQTKSTDLLAVIQSVTSNTWSLIGSLSHDSNQYRLRREVNRLHFQLLLQFKVIKAAIRQMCPIISASSTPGHPMINLLNFFPLNFEVIDSYFNIMKSSKTSFSGKLKMHEHLMGLQEYVFDNLLLKDETNSTFTVANEVKKFYYGLLLVITYLIDPLVQGLECKKHNNLSGTIAIEAGSAIFLSHEDVADINRCRKVNIVLLFLSVAFKFIESEESLMDLLKHKATMRDQNLDLIESALEELIFLRAILMDLLRQHTELNELHNLLMHIEVSAHKLAQFCGSFCRNFMDRSGPEKMSLFSDFRQEVESIKVELRKICFQVVDASPCGISKIDEEGIISFLLTQQDKVPECDAGSTSFLNNQISVVKDKLLHMGSLLADIVQYRNVHLELKDLAKRVQDKKYVCLFSFRGYRPAWCHMLYLSDVTQCLKFVEAEVKMICLKVPDSSAYSFPKTNGLGFLNCLFSKLEELLCSKLDSIVELKHLIESVKDGLLCLRTLTDHFADSLDEHDEVYDLIASGSEIAYKAEYVIDSCLACSHPLWYKVLWISEVVENIKVVNKVVSETCERKKIDVTVHEVAGTSISLSPPLSPNNPRENEEMEGFQDAMNELKQQLLEGSPQLDVVSIVGMPGLGKTTLAKNIYNDPIVTSHFDVRAQCRVTQVYSWRDLLLTILNRVLEPADRGEREDGELADELRRFLLAKRFLIFIDDVWDNKVWDYLHMCFKDARNGSRVILTTRLSDVANYARCESEPHYLRLLRDDESWALLHKEVFQGESCPPELGDVGSRIAKCCKGLPLSIVLVAGFLKQNKNKRDLWKVVEESLRSKSIGSLEESMSIIGLSYKNLPHHLKPCFLYFGGFLKGKDIHVSKLIQLWQAEGFVQANKETAQEDAAQDFLEDLIRRNLVMGMEKRSNGKVKTCGIHDLLHTFCLEKAKQENFLLQINSGEDVFPENPKEYRLFIHSYQDEIELWRPSRSNVRSLLFNAIDVDNLLWPRDISFIFDSFKLVKVLDLESFNIGGTFPSEIQYLTQLRYFAAQTDANSIPSSITKLWNLETFVVRGLGGEMILPSSLLHMVKLRHVHINHRVSFALHENMDESLANSQLANLETFSAPHVSYGEDAEKILRKMPKLRKLSCIFSGTFGYSRKFMCRCVLFPKLEFLSNLESLKLVSNSYPAKLPHEFNFPSKLRELTLSKFRLPWTQISTIAELPNLEILKLCLRTFEGDCWEVNDSEFPELKYLKLDNLKVAQWSVSDDAFPKLERLVLTKCKHLEKIPSHFDDAVSLRSIEVNWCSWSVANSAQEIQTTQREDMANDAFTVTIQPPDWARRSSP